MDEKEKYYAEIETRLVKFNESFHGLKKQIEQKSSNLSKQDIDMLARRKEEIEDKLDELKQAEGKSWKEAKKSLDKMIDDVDNNFREALAYMF